MKGGRYHSSEGTDGQVRDSRPNCLLVGACRRARCISDYARHEGCSTVAGNVTSKTDHDGGRQGFTTASSRPSKSHGGGAWTHWACAPTPGPRPAPSCPAISCPNQAGAPCASMQPASVSAKAPHRQARSTTPPHPHHDRRLSRPHTRACAPKLSFSSAWQFVMRAPVRTQTLTGYLSAAAPRPPLPSAPQPPPPPQE